MEMKNKKSKDQKNPSSTSAQIPETDEVSLTCKIDEELVKEDENSQEQGSVKKPRIDIPSKDDNATPNNHQNPPQFDNNATPDNHQPANEHQQPQVSAASAVPAVASAAGVSRPGWPQVPMNPWFNQVQQLPQAMPAFWPPQRAGYPPFPHVGATDSSWQASAGGALQGTAPGSLGQMPGVCYPVGGPYPPYAGPWDPSVWWSQMQQPAPPGFYPIPGACNFVPSSVPQQPSPVPKQAKLCPAPSHNKKQKGLIRPSNDMSQKHHALWEAQSAENAKLWAVIASLQTELTVVRRRLVKLESKSKTMKPSRDQLETHEAGNGLAAHTTKRGRPKKAVTSPDSLPCSDDLLPPRPQVSRALNKGPPVIREINFHKDNPTKMEIVESFSPIVSHRYGNGAKYTSSQGPAFQNSIQPQTNDHGHLLADSKEKGESVPGNESSTAGHVESTANRSLNFPSNILSVGCMQMLSDMSQGLYSQYHLSSTGNGGDSSGATMNESENASEDLDDETTESDRQLDEERENAEGIPQLKPEDQENGNPPGFPAGNILLQDCYFQA